MMKLRIVNNTVLGLLMALCALAITGVFNFGHGLGNIAYYPPILLATAAHFIITIRMIRKKEDRYWFIIIVLSLLVCLAIMYKATIGRGPEFAWDGEIFFY